MAGKKKVALVSAFPLYTGTTNVVLDYQKALMELGFDVHLYQLVIPDDKMQYPEANVVIKGFKFITQSASLPLNLLFHFPRSVGTLQEDIVILTDPILLTLKTKNPRAILLLHDLRDLSEYSRSPMRKAFFKYLLRFIRNGDKILSLSQYSKEFLINHCGPDIEVLVVEGCSPISVEEEKLNVKVSRAAFPKDTYRVVYVTADRPYKNIQLFVKVAELMEKTYSDNRFRFILVSKLRKYTDTLVKSCSLTNLKVIDHVDDMGQFYYNSDILLYPSLIEGFGLPLVEAMAYGIPIIYSNRRPMTDIVGHFGKAVEPEIPEIWVRELLYLTDPDNYCKASLLSLERARNYTFENFKINLSKALNIFGY